MISANLPEGHSRFPWTIQDPNRPGATAAEKAGTSFTILSLEDEPSRTGIVCKCSTTIASPAEAKANAEIIARLPELVDENLAWAQLASDLRNFVLGMMDAIETREWHDEKRPGREFIDAVLARYDNLCGVPRHDQTRPHHQNHA